MNQSENSRQRRFLKVVLLIAVPLIAVSSCCWLFSRLSGSDESPNDLIPDEGITQNSADLLTELDQAGIQAMLLDERGGTIRLGLVLTTIEVDRTEQGVSIFEAELINIGDFPLENARVNLRLLDKDGQIIESIDMRTPTIRLEPGESTRVSATFEPGAQPPRIVEERIFLESDSSRDLTIYSYRSMKKAQGFLSQLSGALPFLGYEATWTMPESDWESYEVRFGYGRILMGE